jgi:hypothetical protein
MQSSNLYKSKRTKSSINSFNLYKSKRTNSQSIVATVYQAKAVLGTVNSEMKPDEIRKFKFVYQNSGNCPWPSDVKLIRVSGDQLETEINIA